MSKYFLTLGLQCFLLLTTLSLARGETKSVYPLLAWDYVDNAKTLKAMSDCGVNCVAFIRPNMLDACQKYKLKALVFDERVSGDHYGKPFEAERFEKNFPALAKKVNKHPAVMGYHIKDEPGANEFPALGRAVTLVKKLAPGKWPYINLFPGMGKDYDSYLEQFASICSPTAFSYDNYPLGEDGKLSYGFWVNIAQVREAALKHGLPFWNIILTAPHWNYRELTQADLRLQMYGSLVYGAKGISFYKFMASSLPIVQAPDLGNFRMAPLDQFGEKTSTWDWLRNVNHQVQNIGPTMLKLRSDDVYHIGGDLPDRNHRPTETNLVKNISGEFVVGDFTHEDGTRYVMIVNKNLTHSYRCMPELNIVPKELQFVSSWTGDVKKFPMPFYTYFLAPGQGVLLRLAGAN
jgi:hypothetical protein